MTYTAPTRTPVAADPYTTPSRPTRPTLNRPTRRPTRPTRARDLHARGGLYKDPRAVSLTRKRAPMRESIWLDCAFPGCPNGTYADPRHLANVCGAGGWYCNHHEGDESTDAA